MFSIICLSPTLDLTVKTDYSLIKVATSTIINNEELVFELTEGHFEHIIGLLLAITTNNSDSQSHDDTTIEFNPLGIVILDGIEIKWSPKGAEELLDFLNASVCVAGMYLYGTGFDKSLLLTHTITMQTHFLSPNNNYAN